MSSRIKSIQNELITVEPVTVPEQAAYGLVYRGNLYTEPPLNVQSLEDFDLLMKYSDDNTDVKTYLGAIYKQYRDGSEEHTIQLVDVERGVSIIGSGEINYSDVMRETDSKKPSVGWTSTRVDRRGEGWGRRRLLLMNLASIAVYGEPLHSDTVIVSEAAHSIWGRLIDEGQAYSYAQTNELGKRITRYAFYEP